MDNANLAATNGNGKSTPASAGSTAIGSQHIDPRKLAAIQSKVMAANFGNIVTVLMQSSVHNVLPLTELYDLVMPALRSKQFYIAEAQNKDTGATAPAAVALWASVSKEVDERLVKNIDKPVRLSTEECKSGDIIWMIELLGDKRFIAPMREKLNENIFKDKTVKYRMVDADGKASVMQLNPPAT